jgi:putative transposase
VTSKYELVDTEKVNYPVINMCAWTDVSKAGFYDWASRPVSATVSRREKLKVLIAHVFAGSDGTYGYRRVHAALARAGAEVGPELVRHLMRVLDLTPCQPRPWRGEDDRRRRRRKPAGPLGAGLLRDRAGEQGRRRYSPRAGGAPAHRVRHRGVGHGRDPVPVCRRCDLSFRPGVQSSPRCAGEPPTCQDFADRTNRLGIRRSVGRTGVCYANAQAETFNPALKSERVNRTEYPTQEHARKDVSRYIEVRYNTLRLHSALGYRNPEGGLQRPYRPTNRSVKTRQTRV